MTIMEPATGSSARYPGNGVVVSNSSPAGTTDARPAQLIGPATRPGIRRKGTSARSAPHPSSQARVCEPK